MCAQALSSEQNTVFPFQRCCNGTIQQLSVIFQNVSIVSILELADCPKLQIYHKDYTDYNSIAHMTTEAVIQIEYIMTNRCKTAAL